MRTHLQIARTFLHCRLRNAPIQIFQSARKGARIEKRRRVPCGGQIRTNFGHQPTIRREADRQRFVVFFSLRDKLRESTGRKYAARDSGSEALSAKRNEGATHPQGFAGRGVRRIWKRVKCEISCAITGEVLRVTYARCKHETLLSNACIGCSGGNDPTREQLTITAVNPNSRCISHISSWIAFAISGSRPVVGSS